MKRLYFYLTLLTTLTVVTQKAISRDYFWIGTTSIWEDGSNWSETKNGVAINSIPSASDDVFIILGNKDVAVIEFKNAACNDLIIAKSGQLLLKGASSAILKIGGDISIGSNTQIINEGIIEFNAKKNTAYNIQPTLFLSTLKINNSAKSVIKNSLNLEGKIIHESGDVVAKSTSISCQSYQFTTPQQKSVQLDKGNLFVHNKTLNPGDAIYIDFSKIVIQNSINSKLTVSGGNTKGGGGNNNKQATQVFTTVTPPTCNGLADGSAVVDSIRTTPGSTGPYVYTWSRSGFPTVTGSSVTGLSNGTYLLRVLDQSDMTTLGVFVSVIEPDPIFANITSSDESCFGECDGSASVFPIGGTPINPGSTYNYIWSNAATTSTITGLCVGTYTVTITDGNGCTNVDNIAVGGPTQVSANVTSTNIICKGDADGTATASPSGGVAPYTFSWSNTLTSATITNLSPGTYTVTVSDNSLCTNSQSVTITEPATLLSASITVNSPVRCNGNTDGILTANGAGGISPYTYAWSNSSTFRTILNIPAGTYTVTITDANNCSKTDQVTLVSPSAIVPVASVVSNVSCFGLSDGEATVTASGGTPGYTYSWSNSATTALISGLSAGTYTVTATDINNCQETTTITITEPAELTTSIINSTAPTCFGGADATAEASPLGGTSPYTFVWSNSATTALVSGLSAGTYTVTTTDANLCTATDQITILPGSQVIPNVTATNISCRGGNNGTATSLPQGGVGPYTFLWSDIAGSTTASIGSLTSGAYTVTVTDNNLCTATETINITEPALGLVASINVTNNLNCAGINDAIIEAQGTGGTAPYSYLWSTTSTASTLSNIGAGTYTVTITDGNTCTATTQITLNSPTPILPQITVDANVSCFGLSDGQATATATGGNPGYSFLWSDNQTTATATGLSAGTYTVTVTDINNCTEETQAIISEPTILAGNIINQLDATCFNGTDGSIEVNGTGGTAPYTFLWSNATTLGLNSGLSAGTYTVTITDLNGCTTTTQGTIGQASQITLTTIALSNPLCNGGNQGAGEVIASGGAGGYSYIWSNSATTPIITGLTAGTYTVTVSDANSCTEVDQFTLTEPSVISTTITSTNNPQCAGLSAASATITPTGGTPGYTFSWSNSETTATISSLSVGTYTVTVSDANNCTAVDQITITQSALINTIVSTTDVDCFGGSTGTADVTPSGGAGGFTFAWSTTATTSAINGLTAGKYFVTVSDLNGCTALDSAEIAEPTQIVTTTSKVDASCNVSNDGSASVTPVGGTPGYSFLWTGGLTTSTINSLNPGKYFVTVTDINNCTQVDSVDILQANPVAITLDSTLNVNCNNGTDGGAFIITSGGTAPYTYLWSNSQTTDTLKNVTAGTYTLTITDANGCTDQLTTTVTEPSPLTTSTNIISNVSCFGSTNGSADVVVSGGTPPYSYLWSNSSTNDTLLNVGAGKYFITITDANNCTKLDSITITEPNQINLTVTSTNVLCNDSANGTANAVATNGTAPYTFSWSNLATNSAITNLLAGTYTVTVSDANGCTSIDSAIITQPAAITSNTDSTDATCTGLADGSITLTVGGGTPNYTFNWSNSVTTQNQTAVSAGKYFVTITDLNGCTKIDSVTVNDGITLFTTIDSIANIDCNGGSNGFIDVEGNGGLSPYTYLWNTTATTDSIGGLIAGAYTVTITDANGCFTDTTINITEPNLLTAITSTTNVSCNGTADGTASAVAAGGTAPYIFAWSTSQTGPSITGLAAGNYTVTVTDNNGCTGLDNFTINPQSNISYRDTISNNNCFGDCNGELGIFALSGGTAPYNFIWSNAATTPFISGLCAGTYTVTISDANNCDSVATYNITEPTQITLSSLTTNSNCTVCDGTAAVNATGGTPGYSYNWLDASFIPIGQTADTARGLCSGVYNVEVTDLNGCRDTISANVIDNNAPIVTTTSTDATCFGLNDGTATANAPCLLTTCSVNWLTITGTPIGQTTSTATGLAAGSYIAEVSDINGCLTLDTVTINSPSQIIPNDFTIPVSCSATTVCDGSAIVKPTGGTAPFTFVWSSTQPIPFGQNTDSISGLCIGTYSVTITDANNCDTVVAINVAQGGTYTATINATDESCFNSCDGTAEVILSGATVGPHTYIWNPTPPAGQQGNSLINGLCAGTYNVTITDANGCTTTANTTIGTQNSIVPNDVFTNESCGGNCDGSATVNPVGGVAPYSFTWTPTPPNGAGTNIASGLCQGPIEVLISDANGCDTIVRFNINGSSPIIPNETVTNATCSGNCDGEVVLAPTGGAVSNYNYIWTPVPANGQGNSVATGLCAGTYSVIISDGLGCDTTLNITISGFGLISSNAGSINASCNSVCDGSAFVTPSGGVAPYTYSWSTSANTDTINNLCAGNYTVTITDANNCSITETIVVTEPLAIGASTVAVDATCNFCDGIATVIPAGVGPYTFNWLDNNLTPINITTSIAINLCSGNYFVDVTDASTGCTDRFSAIINDNGGETVVVTQVDETCSNSCDGTATATFNCTTANCSVEWFNANTGISIGQTTPIATGLCAGNYFVEVTNDSGCVTIETVSINSPSSIFANLTTIDASCTSNCDGSASVAPTGGAGNYTFVWTPAPGAGQGTANASNMCPGNYTVEIIDANGCSIIENVVINSPSALNVTFSSIDPGCGLTNGSITSAVSGGTAPYALQWFDASNTLITGQTNPTINSLSAGSYVLRVRDAQGCEDYFTASISNGNGPIITLDSITNLSCFGDNNASIFITASAGAAPYSFKWLPFGQTFEDLNGLSAGTYTVEVTDANGCISFDSFSIADPTMMNASFNLLDASCGLCDGEAEISITGGTAPYSFNWSNGSDSIKAINLCAGIYVVEVTDANGCEKTFNVGLNNTGGITNLVASTNNASCNNTCDGEATITPIGGVAPYTFYWPHNGSNSATLNNLCAGTYFAQAIDANGCMSVTNVVIGEPAKWNINSSITPVTCNSFPCDGSILLNVTGGIAPYSFNWGPLSLADTNYVDGLCAGQYTVDISDANGCIQMFEFTISNTAIQIDPTPIATNVSCFGACDGELISNLTSQLYTFQWLDATNTAVAAPNTDAQGLCAGVYTLQITSIADGCQYFENITIGSPDQLLLGQPLATDVDCGNDCDGQISVGAFGGKLAYSFIWNDPLAQTTSTVTNFCAGNYTATVTDNNGCTAEISATINAKSLIAINVIDTTNVICSSDCNGTAEIGVSGGIAPYSITWQGGQTGNIATGLCFGANIVTVTDASNCVFTDTVFIGARDTIIAIAGNDKVICDNGTIVLSGRTIGNGVTEAAWYNVPSYTLFSANVDTNFTRNTSGVYQFALIARDGLGCNDTSIKTITINASPLIDAGKNVRIFDDQIAQINPLGGQASFTYLWTPSTNLSDPTIERPTSDTKESITYTLTVTDTNGCSGTDTMRVLYEEPITFPTGFSPNGDAKNDIWNLDFIDAFPNTTVQVFNRWGQMVFESVGYTKPWDGRTNGKDIPSGTYYYIIDLKDDKFEPFTGPITIMR